MIGQFFAAIAKDPRGPEGRMLIKIGVVKSAVGADKYLVQFEAKGYNFSNIIPADQMGSFAFFDTKEARQIFISELLAQNTMEATAPTESSQGAEFHQEVSALGETSGGQVGSPNAISSVATGPSDSAGGVASRRSGRTSRRER
jgi:hypothetical protein